MSINNTTYTKLLKYNKYNSNNNSVSVYHMAFKIVSKQIFNLSITGNCV